MSISLTAMASETCKVDSYAAIFLSNGKIYDSATITDGKFVTSVNNWMECFNFALKKAEQHTGSIDLVAHQKGQADQETAALVYMKWTFNDGFFSDSAGMITKHTSKFINAPAKGDLRVKYDGQRFE